ncbi:MAG: 50S ribosomal protein L18 [bacterium]|nr:50S ribosomal protein L18 [bacterium]
MPRFIQRTNPRDQRRRRIRARVAHRADRPRLSVFRSARHISAQLIDDGAGRTIAAASDRDAKPIAGAVSEPKESRKVSIARAIGKLIAERARAKGVTKVVFDRSGYAYHGQVRAVADGAREGGLEF